MATACRIATKVLLLVVAGAAGEGDECNLFPPLSSWFLDEGVAILSPRYVRTLEVANLPMFPDLDGDFKLEYVYSNHARSHTPNPNEGMVFGRITGPSNFQSVNVTLDRTDTLPIMGRTNVDMHGSAIVDLDRDGHLDMVVLTGGGRGQADGLGYGNVLYWGSMPTGPSMWHAEGGIYTALDAGLQEDSGGENRGRSTYIADFNNDGLLDILTHNEERDDKHYPGRIFYNNGNRTFTMDPTFEEYIQVEVVVGKSLILQRGLCIKNTTSASPERIQFCSDHVRNTWANYTFNESLGRMVRKDINFLSSTAYRHVQVAWIDEDDKPDFFVSSCKPAFIYSSGIVERLTIPRGFGCETSTLQDFNVDGELEVLSIYSQVGTTELRAVLYTRDPNARTPPFWRVKDQVLDWPRRWNDKTGPIDDIASVDYDNDGLMDLAFENDALYHLTNTLWSRGQSSSSCTRPRFIAVVLKGIKSNQYGIGSTILLRATKMGPYRNETRSLPRAVSSYSHGTTYHGGAVDYRTVFGLGMGGSPQSIEVTWLGGETSRVDDEQVLSEHLNDMTNPLIIML